MSSKTMHRQGPAENRKNILSNIKHTVTQILTEILDALKVKYIESKIKTM